VSLVEQLRAEGLGELEQLGPEGLARALVSRGHSLRELMTAAEALVTSSPGLAAPLMAGLFPLASAQVHHELCDAVELWMFEGVDLEAGLTLRAWARRTGCARLARWSETVLRERPRIAVDFNELLEPDLVLLARDDQRSDTAGGLVAMFAGRTVHLVMDDLDGAGAPDPLLATATVEAASHRPLTRGAKWCGRLTAAGLRHRSDLRESPAP
jgi:hypothetical protein